MSWPAHTSGFDYLTTRIGEADAGARVYTANSTDILQWLERSNVQLKSYFISYEGYTFERSREGASGPPRKLYTIYWHGRAGLDVEATMDTLTDAIHSKKTFTIGSDTRTARVTGGRYLLMDRGFDTYQLDIEIN